MVMNLPCRYRTAQTKVEATKTRAYRLMDLVEARRRYKAEGTKCIHWRWVSPCCLVCIVIVLSHTTVQLLCVCVCACGWNVVDYHRLTSLLFIDAFHTLLNWPLISFFTLLTIIFSRMNQLDEHEFYRVGVQLVHALQPYPPPTASDTAGFLLILLIPRSNIYYDWGG